MQTEQIIKTAEEKLIHTYNRYQIVLDKGDGVRLYDTDGKEYLAFCISALLGFVPIPS